MSIWGELFLAFLLNAWWQVAVCAVAGWAVARWLRRAGAGVVCGVWRAALVAGFLLPVLTVAWTFASMEPGPAIADGTRPRAYSGWTIFLLICAFCMIMRLVLLASAFGAALRRKPVEEVALPPWAQDQVGECLRRFRVAAPRIGVGKGEAAYTFGWLKPEMVIPERYLGPIPQKDVAAIIGHELAHIERRDYAWNLLLESLCALVAFHPLAAWMKSQADLFREQACDEMAIDRLSLPAADYAGHLLTFARNALAFDAPRHAMSVTERGTLETRLRRLLSPARRLTGIASTRRIATALATLTVAAWAVPWPALRVEFAPRPDAVWMPTRWMAKAPQPPPPPRPRPGTHRREMPPPPPPPPPRPADR